MPFRGVLPIPNNTWLNLCKLWSSTNADMTLSFSGRFRCQHLPLPWRPISFRVPAIMCDSSLKIGCESLFLLRWGSNNQYRTVTIRISSTWRSLELPVQFANVGWPLWQAAVRSLISGALPQVSFWALDSRSDVYRAMLTQCNVLRNLFSLSSHPKQT